MSRQVTDIVVGSVVFMIAQFRVRTTRHDESILNVETRLHLVQLNQPIS